MEKHVDSMLKHWRSWSGSPPKSSSTTYYLCDVFFLLNSFFSKSVFS